MDPLPPERWKQIDDLLDAALARAPDERDAFLRAACGDDPALFREVSTLVEDAEPAAELLGDSATAFAAPLLAADPPPAGLRSGTRVGPYRIEEEIGRGGMGVVYRARRADGTFEKEVALKLVKRGMDTDEVLARFRRERQVLAGLDHPGIARLLDGGATDDGRPFLVMEFVEGEPITAYCDEGGLEIETRLALFERACEAVQHAHRRLVVHRDLKPSNVLVTDDEDGEAQVKLLDFGIARLLEARADEALTQVGARRLTPAYAAPEQRRGEAVTTTADVYALGVVLYELLTGHRPDSPPHPPSAAVEDEATRRQLRGDLDVIVGKALRAEAAERYPSVEALLDDLRRHRTGLPVAARPASVGYRVRKFIGRHRIGVAAAAAFVVLLVAAVAALAVQQRQTARERDRAEEVTRFLSDLFASNAPSTAPTDTVTARTLLTRGEERVYTLDGQPVVQAYMLQALGSAWLDIGRYDRAESLLDQALALSRSHLGAGHLDVATSLTERARLAYLTGDYDRANALDRKALTILRGHFGGEHARVADVLASLAVNHSEQGAYAAADSLFDEALAVYRRAGLEKNPDAITTLRNFAALRQRNGDYAAADSLYQQAIGQLRGLYGPEHPQIALTLDNLGVLRYQQGDPEAALALAREALAMRQHLLGDEHPDAIATMANVATLLEATGDAEAAEALHRRVLALRREHLGDDHPHVASTLTNLATVFARQGRFTEAEGLLREGLAIQRATLGNDHPHVASTLNSLASVLREQEAYSEAETLYREALALRRSVLGDDHPDIARTLSSLGRLKHMAGDLPAAEDTYREALAVRRAALGDRHPNVALSQMRLAELLRDQRAFERAEAFYREALSIYEEALGEEHPRAQQAREGLAALYEAWDRPADAARYR